MKSDLKKLLKLFKTTGFKNGDLVITAEIHRVINKDWGRQKCSSGIEVATLFPKCQTCKPNEECTHSRIMETGHGGQQNIMALVKPKGTKCA